MSSQKPPCSRRLGNTYECLLLDFNFCMHAANQKVHLHRWRRFTTHREGTDLTQHTLQEICESRSKLLRSCHKVVGGQGLHCWSIAFEGALLVTSLWAPTSLGMMCNSKNLGHLWEWDSVPQHKVPHHKFDFPAVIPGPQPAHPVQHEFPKLTATCQLHRHCITWTQPLPVLPRIATLASHNQMKLRELSHRCSLQLVVLSWCPGRSQSATTRRRPWSRVKPEAWTGIGCRLVQPQRCDSHNEFLTSGSKMQTKFYFARVRGWLRSDVSKVTKDDKFGTPFSNTAMWVSRPATSGTVTRHCYRRHEMPVIQRHQGCREVPLKPSHQVILWRRPRQLGASASSTTFSGCSKSLETILANADMARLATGWFWA